MIPGSHIYNARVLISDAWEPGNEASLVVIVSLERKARGRKCKQRRGNNTLFRACINFVGNLSLYVQEITTLETVARLTLACGRLCVNKS